ncbi:MAG TPA: hypothetical protein DDX40_07775 [Rikenellaceae bacterium]|nr:hypothetical protein [Rikenellaceae bacterium]
MALEIEGRIKQKLAKQNGQGAKGSWTKQDFVLEYQDGNYPADVCLTAFGNDKVADLDKYQIGDSVKVAFNLRAREYNGRWYNDVRVWRITPAGQGSQAQQSAYQAQQNYTQAPQPNYGAQPQQQAPAPTIDDLPADDPGNDLPF